MGSQRVERFTMSTAGYLVEGLACRRCLAKVLERVRSLAGVSKVAMDLGAGGLSPLLVMSGTMLAAPVVREAVESVGFGLLPPRGAGVDPPGGGASTLRGDTGPNRQRMLSFVGGVRS
jgi:copper chaperone